MNRVTPLDGFGVVTEPATLRIQRMLPGPIARVWSYLTESELRRHWLAAGEMALEPGAAFEFTWRNDELSSAPSERPAGFPAEERMASTITEVDPPHRISFTWDGSGEVTFELETQGDEVLLTVIHRRLPDRRTLLQVAAGWHRHLDILVDRFSAREPAAFWPGWRLLEQEYDRRLAG